jgi:hypothetical protein
LTRSSGTGERTGERAEKYLQTDSFVTVSKTVIHR